MMLSKEPSLATKFSGGQPYLGVLRFELKEIAPLVEFATQGTPN
jgi:hypothetical protein